MTSKRFGFLFLAVVVANIALLFVGGGSDHAAAPGSAKPLRVGLVFDVGGRGDKSFNDMAYLGLERARRELGVEVEYIEPGEGSDRESALRLLAAQKFDLIIGVGFIFTDDVNNMAIEYPNVRFACIDYVVKVDDKGNEVPPPPNVAALKFREEEGSFLVGAVAALASKTGRIGFVGGMDIPLIHKFEAGYRAGAKAVRPDVAVVANYAGVTGAAFKDPAKGKELAMGQYAGGADVIFHASGSTGLGVFEAARNLGKLAIGVDADQYSEAPGFILTSMTKKVDVAVFTTIRECLENRFAGGVKIFGLKQDGVGYVYDEHNRNLITDDAHARIEELKKKIVDGEIKVPSA